MPLEHDLQKDFANCCYLGKLWTNKNKKDELLWLETRFILG
jgi:hypothetical protein